MEKIAIIGLGCLFPGAKNPAEYWRNLISARDTTSLATAAEMGVDPDIFFDPRKGETDRYYSKRGGFIHDFTFDPTGFDLPAEVLVRLDSAIQWPLYVARQALEDSGYAWNRAALERCGLILGNLSFPTRASHRIVLPYYAMAFESGIESLLGERLTLPKLDGDAGGEWNRLLSGYSASIAAKALSLNGPTFAMDAACASSLYSVKLASHYLLSGKADLMLAGAVSCADPLFIHMGFSIFNAYPETGRSLPLDKSTDGLVASEGAGVFVLKRLTDAVRDGDQIHAVIEGIGLSNDGRGKFLLSPQARGQVLAYERAYGESGVDPARISYLECHATGTKLGDKTEMMGIDEFFGRHKCAPLAGAAKSNFGHLLTAAGMAGMLKVILSMKEGVIPPTIHVTDPVESPNRVIGESQVVRTLTAWPVATGRTAAVNAFGFGGANAHAILAAPDAVHATPSEPKPPSKLAIVGMEAIFGPCPDLDAFARSCHDGASHFRLPPPQRWKGIDQDPALLESLGFAGGKPPVGAYIESFDMDFLEFGIPPRQPDQPIPQQLLALKAVDKAIRDAGLKETRNTAVILAMGAEMALHQFRGRCDLTWQVRDALAKQGLSLTAGETASLEAIAKDSLHKAATVAQYTSFIGNIMASRISAHWDFRGPAFTVSAEELSVFRAIEAASLLLNSGEADAVVVGAVSLSGGVEEVVVRHGMHALNSGPATLSLGEGVNGWMIGEGAGAIVLKREADAAGDRVYAVVDSVHFAASPADAASAALAAAGVSANEIGYLEASASGVPDEDARELLGLAHVYSAAPARTAIGGAKAHIGHTFAAAGMAGVIRAALALHQRFLPPTPNWTAPKAGLSDQLYIVTEPRPWFSDEGKRIAAVNGMCADGMCAHVVMSEGQGSAVSHTNALAEYGPYLFPLVGDSEPALNVRIEALRAEAADGSLADLARDCWESARANPRAAYALALVAGSAEVLEAQAALAIEGIRGAFARGGEWKTPAGSYFTANPLGPGGKIAFVYPGAFNGYRGMGGELARLFPDQLARLERMAPKLGESMGSKFQHPRQHRALTKAEEKDAATAFAADTPVMMESGIAFAWLCSKALREIFGVKPDAGFGYSLGESMMMFGLDAWSVADNRRDLLRSSPLFRSRLTGPKDAVREYWKLGDVTGEIWANYVLKSPPDVIRKAIADEPRVFLTHINTRDEVVIGGDPESCKRLIANLGAKSLRAPYDDVLHCPAMASDHHHFVAMNSLPVHKEAQAGIDFYFAADPDRTSLDGSVGEKIATGACHTLDFPELVNRVYEDGVRIFIELGPGHNCARWIPETLGSRPHLAASVNRRGQGDRVSFVRLLGRLFSHRVAADLSPLYAPKPAKPAGRTLVRQVNLGGESIAAAFAEARERVKFNLVKLPPPAVEAAPPQGNPMSTTNAPETAIAPTKAIWDYDALMHFAGGRVADVFGPEYAIIDTYKRCTRLPLPPYLLVSRVTKIDAKRGEFKPSTMTTEYDIPPGAWYSVDGQAPLAVAVESGQCDLMLISYLGIDFDNKGDRIYRLLDCTLTFTDTLPMEGETLRYDIGINSFAKSGDNLLFFFSYRCYVGEKLVLKMDGGCAGFFSDQDLAKGKGIIITEKEKREHAAVQKRHFTPLLVCGKTAFSKDELLLLTKGQIAACFGPEFEQQGANPSLRYATPRMMMIDRITEVDNTGGPWGLGTVVAEKDLAPNDWYFPCHFKDDNVLAGSLMADGCAQLLQFFMLRLGLQTRTRDARFQPIPNLAQNVRCRGQVIPKDRMLVYKLEVTEIGLEPEPYAKANVDVILEGRPIVSFKDLGVRLVEKAPVRKEAVYNESHIDEFATGDLAKCFGPDYEIYRDRRAPRTPNGPLQLIHRIVETLGERRKVEAGARVVSEYDVAANPWWAAEGDPVTPYSILMELGLQPCGFLTAWLGSTLMYPDEEFCFRNLDGTGKLIEDIDLRGKTVTDRVKMLTSTAIQGIIIQKFEYQLLADGRPFYEGDASFGYFTPASLATQVGLDAGKLVLPWYKQNGVALQLNPVADHVNIPQFRLLDTYAVMADGGKAGKGYVTAHKTINVEDWFYKAHFYQDPVMPGSLGVEAILEAMKLFARDRALTRRFRSPRFEQLAGQKFIWKYRGQIRKINKVMDLDVHVTGIHEDATGTTIVGDANLWNESVRIYEVRQVAIRIVEA